MKSRLLCWLFLGLLVASATAETEFREEVIKTSAGVLRVPAEYSPPQTVEMHGLPFHVCRTKHSAFFVLLGPGKAAYTDEEILEKVRVLLSGMLPQHSQNTELLAVEKSEVPAPGSYQVMMRLTEEDRQVTIRVSFSSFGEADLIVMGMSVPEETFKDMLASFEAVESASALPAPKWKNPTKIQLRLYQGYARLGYVLVGVLAWLVAVRKSKTTARVFGFVGLGCVWVYFMVRSILIPGPDAKVAFVFGYSLRSLLPGVLYLLFVTWLGGRRSESAVEE